jgi:hypothetical protein
MLLGELGKTLSLWDDVGLGFCAVNLVAFCCFVSFSVWLCCFLRCCGFLVCFVHVTCVCSCSVLS